MAGERQSVPRGDILTRSLVLATIVLGGCLPSGSVGQHEEPIVAGVSDPEALGRSVPELQQNAVVKQLLMRGGPTSLTCTGTLIGDRVILTGGHCVMQNMEAWWLEGDPLIVAEPAAFDIRIGPDAEHPACVLDVAEVHLHPEILRRFEDAAIDRDLALLVLESGASESCPDVLPIPLVGPEEEPPDLDESLLLGGYGITDPEEASAVNWERFWAVAPLSERTPEALVLEDVGTGFPGPGDSGSPVLRAAADGSLRVVGVTSTSYWGIATATRPESEPAFLDDVLDRELLCGSISDAGTCVGDLAVRCEEDALTVLDCAAGSHACVEGETARCVCGCDVDARCAGDCPCDPDCPCACDSTAGCDDECSCDPECAEPSCACDETAACDPDCGCDPTCASTECDCDATSACDEACVCDLDCAAAPLCACDASSGCDEDCDCDADCRHRASGCAVAPSPPAAGPVWPWLGLLAVVFAAGRPALTRRARCSRRAAPPRSRSCRCGA